MAQSKIRGSKQFYADADIDFNSKKITGLATPTLDTDAATKAYVDQILAAGDALIYKGVIDCSANPNYPAADAGHTYKVSVAGKIGGASGPDVVAGDLIICTTDGTTSGDHATKGSFWDIVHVAGAAGTVISTAATPLDNQIVRLDGTGGVTIQNSLAVIDDNGAINIPSGQAYKINGSALNQDNVGDGTTNKAYTAIEQTKLAGIETAADVTDAGNVGSSINGASAKATIVDGDKFAIADSEASGVLKTTLWSLIKSTLKTYFDTLYATVGHTHTGTYLAPSGYVAREVPAGTLNGSNVTFTLANTPTSGTEMLFLNGILQNAGAGNDYTISGGTITMAVAPVSTDLLLVTYWK